MIQSIGIQKKKKKKKSVVSPSIVKVEYITTGKRIKKIL